MTTRSMMGWICGSAVAVVVLLSAGLAEAKTVWRWQTEEGVYAFTDDPKRIPARYRSQARASTLRPLATYSQYTPAQRSGQKSWTKNMQQAARNLAELNARVDGRGPGVVYGVADPGTDAVIRSSTSGQTFVEAQTGLATADSGEPLVIEEKRFYVPGLNVTRRDTIVRQGDRILAITKPLPNQDDISQIPSESVLPD